MWQWLRGRRSTRSQIAGVQYGRRAVVGLSSWCTAVLMSSADTPTTSLRSLNHCCFFFSFLSIVGRMWEMYVRWNTPTLTKTDAHTRAHTGINFKNLQVQNECWMKTTSLLSPPPKLASSMTLIHLLHLTWRGSENKRENNRKLSTSYTKHLDQPPILS